MPSLNTVQYLPSNLRDHTAIEVITQSAHFLMSSLLPLFKHYTLSRNMVVCRHITYHPCQLSEVRLSALLTLSQMPSLGLTLSQLFTFPFANTVV